LEKGLVQADPVLDDFTLEYNLEFPGAATGDPAGLPPLPNLFTANGSAARTTTRSHESPIRRLDDRFGG
jgi:hypothetical protein